MDDKIKDAMYQAYTGESKAALRLKVFAEKAMKDGYPQLRKPRSRGLRTIIS